MMTRPHPDGSRDLRIEDPSNLWLIHPAGRALLPHAVALGISANAVSVAGLLLGGGAAACFARWSDWRFVVLGLLLAVGWLIADGLDGMIARATGTASPLGRMLDGLCDHGVFVLIYVTLALSLGTVQGWALAVAAGVAHAVQSSLYEGERARFHRRARGIAQPALPAVQGNALVRLYDIFATSLDRVALRFERRMARAEDPASFGQTYARAAAPAMKWMAWLTANVRVEAIAIACLLGDPQLFWGFEIVVLSAIAAITIARHRAVERRLAGDTSFLAAGGRIAGIITTKEQGHR
ncbi:CDP-alcohol phosphatidyltransferase family protein [Sphingomonas sp.]|uniref:CDP-alcohol phosphatidyltransferase family protein n=1 Tax=Sphingomonas sp. TaxID=28214 RepID=UPI0035BC3967